MEFLFDCNALKSLCPVCTKWSPPAQTVGTPGSVTYADSGWNGMTVVDLESGSVHYFEIPDWTLDVQLLSR
ncbi:hypothetical protein [Paenibacillus sp. Soil787]|uniref:hypothetical protein n=1 Tax=Paenibacillus sp. Soil787 TaxID=1736411 RepID=UPI0006FED837|nr:hypothetical protein [Paenibacillus sp. Soil787]KRF43994.1 hypothetical protein ASG93_03525 [Paenibacillus sp. Soil787]